MKRFFVILFLFSGLGFAIPLRAQGDPELAGEAAALGPQTPALQVLLQREAKDPASRDFVLETLRGAQDLKSHGLPTEPYLLKANEGLAKGVPANRILPALQQSRHRTETAARLVDSETSGKGTEFSPQARRHAILQTQGLLLNGVSPRDIEKNWEKTRGNSENAEGRIEAAAQSLAPRRHHSTPAPLPPKLEGASPEKIPRSDHEGFEKKVREEKPKKEFLKSPPNQSGKKHHEAGQGEEPRGREKEGKGHGGRGHGWGKGKDK